MMPSNPFHPTTGVEDPTPHPHSPKGVSGLPSPDPLLDRVAAQVVRRGLVTPALFFLELHRPLSFLAGQATHALQPFLAPLFGYQTVQRLARLLEDPANVDRLLERIEQLETGVQVFRYSGVQADKDRLSLMPADPEHLNT
jgi:hypothetical protein